MIRITWPEEKGDKDEGKWVNGDRSIRINLSESVPVHGDTIDSRLLSVFLVTFTTTIAALKNHDSNR